MNHLLLWESTHHGKGAGFDENHFTQEAASRLQLNS